MTTIGKLSDMPRIEKNLATMLRKIFPTDDKVNLEEGVLSIANYLERLQSTGGGEMMEKLRQEKGELESKLKECEDKNKDLNEENGYLKTEKSELSDANTNLDASNALLNTKITDLTKKNTTLNLELKNMRSTNKNMNESIKNCENENSDLKQQLQTLTAENAKLDLWNKQNVKKIEDYDTMDQENKKIVLEFKELNNTIETLQSTNDDILNKTKDTDNKKDQTIAEKTEENLQLTGKIAELTKQIEDLTSENAKQLEMNTKLLAEMSALKTKTKQDKEKYNKKVQELVQVSAETYAGLNELFGKTNADDISYGDPAKNLSGFKEPYKELYKYVFKPDQKEILPYNDNDTIAFNNLITNKFKIKVREYLGLPPNDPIHESGVIYQSENEFHFFTKMRVGIQKYVGELNKIIAEKQDKLNTSNSELETCKNDLSQKIVEFEQNKTDLTSKINSLEQSLTETQASLKACESKNESEINNRIVELTNELNNVNNEKSRSETKIGSEITDLKQQLATIQSINTKLETEKANANIAKEAADNSLTEATQKHSTEIAVLEAKIKEYEEKINKGINELNTILVGGEGSTDKPETGNTEENIDTQFETIKTALSNKITHLETELAECKSDANTKTNKIAALQDKLKQAATEEDKKALDLVNDEINSINKALGGGDGPDNKNLNETLETNKKTLDGLIQMIREKLSEPPTTEAPVSDYSVELYKQNLASLLEEATKLQKSYIETKVAIKNIGVDAPATATDGGDILFTPDPSIHNDLIAPENLTYNKYTISPEIDSILSNPLNKEATDTIQTYTTSVFTFIDQLINDLNGQKKELDTNRENIYNQIGNANTATLDTINQNLGDAGITIEGDTTEKSVVKQINDKIDQLKQKIKDCEAELGTSQEQVKACEEKQGQIPVPSNKTVNLANLIQSISQNLPKIIKPVADATATTTANAADETPTQEPMKPPKKLTISIDETIPIEKAIYEYTKDDVSVSIKHGNNFVYNANKKNYTTDGIIQLYTQGGKTYTDIPVYFYLTLNPDTSAIEKVEYSKGKNTTREEFSYSKLDKIYDNQDIATIMQQNFKDLYKSDEEFIAFLKNIVINIEQHNST